MNNLTDEQKKQLSSAYHSMMAMDAWQDLVAYAKEERESSFKRSDSKSAGDLTIGEICEERGIRKGLFKLLQYAEFKREGV